MSAAVDGLPGDPAHGLQSAPIMKTRGRLSEIHALWVKFANQRKSAKIVGTAPICLSRRQLTCRLCQLSRQLTRANAKEQISPQTEQCSDMRLFLLRYCEIAQLGRGLTRD